MNSFNNWKEQKRLIKERLENLRREANRERIQSGNASISSGISSEPINSYSSYTNRLNRTINGEVEQIQLASPDPSIQATSSGIYRFTRHYAGTYQVSNDGVNWIIINSAPPRPRPTLQIEQLPRGVENVHTGHMHQASPNLTAGTIARHKEDPEITLVFDKHPYLYTYELPVTGLDIVITRSPMGNCQAYTISDFEFILTEESAEGGKTVLESMTTIQNKIRKPLILLDVKATVADTLRKLFKDDIVSDAPYTSSNGSHMNLLMIKTNLLST